MVLAVSEMSEPSPSVVQCTSPECAASTVSLRCLTLLTRGRSLPSEVSCVSHELGLWLSFVYDVRLTSTIPFDPLIRCSQRSVTSATIPADVNAPGGSDKPSQLLL